MSDILILTGTALMAVSLVLALAALARTEPPRGAAIAFVFGVVETSSPYLSMCGMIDEAGRESGQRKTRKALQDFARCVEKNEWPGYEGVQSISLPRYALDVEC